MRVFLIAVLAVFAACPYPALPDEPDAKIDAALPPDAPSIDWPDGLPDAGTDAAISMDAPNCARAVDCAQAIDLGTVTADAWGGAPYPFPLTATFESNGDPNWYKVRLADTLASGNLTASVHLTMSAGTDYDVGIYCECGGQIAATGAGSGQSETAYLRDDDTAADDSREVWILVSRNASALTCGPYRIEVAGNVTVPSFGLPIHGCSL